MIVIVKGQKVQINYELQFIRLKNLDGNVSNNLQLSMLWWNKLIIRLKKITNVSNNLQLSMLWLKEYLKTLLYMKISW